MTAGRTGLAVAGAIALLAALVFVAFAVGRYPVGPAELVAVMESRIFGTEHGLATTVETVVFGIRGPRILASSSRRPSSSAD